MCNLVLKGSGLDAELGQSLLGLSLCFTYINPEVLNIFRVWPVFLKSTHLERNLYLPLLKKKKDNSEMNSMCYSYTQRLTVLIIHTDFSDI